MGMTKAERLERDIRLMDEMKEHEEELRSSGLLLVAGMDEAGPRPPCRACNCGGRRAPS